MTALPQLVDAARRPVALQAAVLGLCFVVLDVLSDGLYALAAVGLGAVAALPGERPRRV